MGPPPPPPRGSITPGTAPACLSRAAVGQRMAREAEEASRRGETEPRAAGAGQEAGPGQGGGSSPHQARTPAQGPAASPVDKRHPWSAYRESGPAPVTHAAPGSAAFATEVERLRSHTRAEMARGLEERPAPAVCGAPSSGPGPSSALTPRAPARGAQDPAKALRAAGRGREMAERQIVRRAVSDVRAACCVLRVVCCVLCVVCCVLCAVC